MPDEEDVMTLGADCVAQCLREEGVEADVHDTGRAEGVRHELAAVAERLPGRH
ncbi:hypothetical protein AB0D84_26820 [Streptomyces sp. NPDC048193]|uniref:hypothetical protein n=1 Tax=unclassified Streptomyces TaxID=2593676 RepID=UPI00341DB242